MSRRGWWLAVGVAVGWQCRRRYEARRLTRQREGLVAIFDGVDDQVAPSYPWHPTEADKRPAGAWQDAQRLGEGIAEPIQRQRKLIDPIPPVPFTLDDVAAVAQGLDDAARRARQQRQEGRR